MSAPYGLTVGQLKALLASMPESFDDKIVVLASDPEGNSFDTLGEVAVGWYRNEYEGQFEGRSPEDDDTWEKVEAEATNSYGYDDEDLDQEDAEPISLDEHDHPAICLWP